MIAMMKEPMEQLLTVEEVAYIFNAQPETIRLWFRNGVLPGIKVGRQWKMAPGAAREIIAGHHVLGQREIEEK